MKTLNLAILFVAAFSVMATAQNSSSSPKNSSNSQGTSSSSSFSCPCHPSLASAEKSLTQLHKECKEQNGNDMFSMKKMSEDCYCIEGACDIHFSSANSDTTNLSSSSSLSSSSTGSSSSMPIYSGGKCHIEDTYFEPLRQISTVHQDLYSVWPFMANPESIHISNCSCNEDGSFKCTYVNFGFVQGYLPEFLDLCYLSEAYWCPGLGNGYCDYSGSSVVVYHSDQYYSSGYTWGTKDFTGKDIMEIENMVQPVYVTSNIGLLTFFKRRHLFPSNVSTYDLENAFYAAYPRIPSIDKMHEFCRGEWYPHDEDCFGYASEVETAMQDSIDNCTLAMGIPNFDTTLSNRGWCVVGSCNPGENPYYSSSSSENESSSSEDGLCKSVPVNEFPDNIKSACFENSGHCFKCKAKIDENSCRNSWSWQAPQVPVDTFHWFNEVDCSTGEKLDKGIGMCPAQPLDSIPKDLSKACFAWNGKCYRCKNPSPSGGCAEHWIWTEKLYYVEPHYLEEVDCYNPFEDDEEDNFDRCLAGNALFKQNVHSVTIPHEDLVTYSPNVSRNTYFDILGRRELKKTDNYIKLYNVDFTPSRMLALTNAISGHTDADINIDWCVSNEEKKDGKTTYTLNVAMTTKITNDFTSTNTKLQAHEDKHKELYMDQNLAFGSWEGVSVDIPKGKTKKEKCRLIVDSFWESESNSVAVKWNVRSLLNAHNNWDYQDPNNEGFHISFPDVEKTLDSLYNIQLKKCRQR